MALYTNLHGYIYTVTKWQLHVQIDDKKTVLELARIPFIYTSFIVSYIIGYKDKVPKHLKYIV